MKIAVNTRLLLPGKLEGIGWFAHELLRRWVLRHPEHEFVFFFDRPYDPRFRFADNVRLRHVPPPARHPFLFIAWFEGALRLALAQERPDVLFSPDGFIPIGGRTPTLNTVHDIAHQHFPQQVPRLEKWYYDRYLPRFLARAERTLTVSEFSKQDLIRRYGLPAGRIAVACNGVREQFRPLDPAEQAAVRAQWSEGQPYFFYSGSVHPRKNVARLIAAFDAFKASSGLPHRLLLAGRMAWMAEDVREALARSPYRAHILLPGYLDDAALAALCGAAFALTYVSLFEGFGVPLIEAMHCGVPVITSDRSAMPEVAGGAALLVDPESVASIAGAMARLAQDAPLRGRLIAEGLARSQHYTWERAADLGWAALCACLPSAHPLRP